MPSSIQTIKGVLVSQVNAAHASKNWSYLDQFAVRTGGAGTVYAHGTFALPAKKGTLYSHAKVIVYNKTSLPAGSTIQLMKVTSGWSIAKTTWNSRPGATSAGAVSVTHAAASPAGTAWVFDIKDYLNSISGSGATWYGFRFNIVGDTVARWFHNHKGPAQYVPVLEYNYSEAPDAPSQLTPSGGRAVSIEKPVVACDFYDLNGNTEISGINVQINPSDIWTAPAFDSGDVPTSAAELDLATTTFVGIAFDEILYWRVRVKDGDDNWSEWSNSTTFTRKAKETLVINNPAIAPNDYVAEVTPPILWTSPNQRNFQVQLHQNGKLVSDSGKLTSPDGAWTIPPTIIKAVGDKYLLTVGTWDNVDRVSTPGDDPVVLATREFTYEPSATVASVTGLTATWVGPGPHMALGYDRATSPDSFTLYRDDLVFESGILPEDVFVSGTHYEFVDRKASGRMDHEWSVAAVENGVTSLVNPVASGSLRPVTAFLCSEDGRFVIPLTDYDNGLNLGDDSTVSFPLNSDEGVVTSQNLRGFGGEFSGIMSSSVGNKTSAEYLADLMAVRNEPGLRMQLSWADQNISCVVFGIDYKTAVYSEEILYRAVFQVVQKRSVGQVSMPI